jgi:hypothetical protein
MKTRLGLLVLFLLTTSPRIWACDPSQKVGRINRKLAAGGDSVEVLYQGWGFPKSVEVSNYDGDCYPWVSADGRFLFFGSINFAGPEREGHQGFWDIYQSRWDSVHQCWGPPQNLGRGVNTPASEHRPSCTPNGDTLFFERAHDIYMSTWDGSRWTPAETLPFPINTRANEEHPAISFDGRRLYFTSNRDTLHGKDIWVAYRTGANWDSVVSIGRPINTPNEETRPFESADGQRLYFCNNHGEPRPGESFGGPGDIYVSIRQGDSWGPVRLVAAPVNDDLVACAPCESGDGRTLYFGSHATEGSRGDEDIWVVVKDSMFPPGPARGYGDWVKTGELGSAIHVYDLAEGMPGVVFAATACSDTAPVGRVYVTTDQGANWNACADLSGVMAVYGLMVEGDTVLAGTYPNGDVFRSTDRGGSWTNVGELPRATAVRSIERLANGDILTSTSPYDINQENPLYRSTNNGQDWVEVATLAGINPCFMIAQVSTGTVFCGGWGIDSYVYLQRSTDNGATWDTTTVIPQEECEWTANDLLEHEDGTIYVSGWIPSQEVGLGGGYVCKSADDGLTWEPCTKIVRGDSTHSSTIHAIIEAEDGRILVGMQPAYDSVVFASDDGGSTWVSTGGLDGAYECLCLLEDSDGNIYAGTTPNGDVFRFEPAGVVEERARPTIAVSVVSVLGGAAISYAVPGPGRCEMVVFDNTGRRVRTLLSDVLAAGRYRLGWDGQDDSGVELPAGTYTVRLSTPAGMTSCRMVLVD